MFNFFSLPLIFTLVAASISYFLATVTKFSYCSSNEKCLLCFFLISRSSSLSLFFSLIRWPVTYFLFVSVLLFLHIPNVQTLQLIYAQYFSQHGYRNNFRFPSLVISASKDAGGYAISRQNNLELHLGCHTC